VALLIDKPQTVEGDGFRITLNKQGENAYIKQRRPVIYGVHSEIMTDTAILHFNKNNEIVRAEGRGADWPSDLDFLKRTAGNDWVYYSSGGYTGARDTLSGETFSAPVSFRNPSPYSEVYKMLGEYYLPNLPYDSNSILEGVPFNSRHIKYLIETWYSEVEIVCEQASSLPPEFQAFLTEAGRNSPDRLQRKAEQLFDVCGGRQSVLPPDTRHVDYNVIPLNITRGCLYKCSFCQVKNKSTFSTATRAEIDEQLLNLLTIYDRDICNYNALFLGEHDALNAPDDILLYAIKQAIDRLGLTRSYMRGGNIFLFGSVASFMGKEERLFSLLSKLDVNFYINIGLESADQATLDHLGKPLKSEQVIDCFERMQHMNRKFENVEFTANFVLDEGLPDGHIPAFLDLVGNNGCAPSPKGTVYLSPLCFTPPSARSLFEVSQLKALSNYPTFLYLIQQL